MVDNTKNLNKMGELTTLVVNSLKDITSLVAKLRSMPFEEKQIIKFMDSTYEIRRMKIIDTKIEK